MQTTQVLPAGFTVRPATLDDVAAITHLINTCEIAEIGSPDHPLAEMRTFMTAPGLNLATDSWNVYTLTGELVAHALLRSRQQVILGGNGWVLPEYQGRGLGTYLLGLLEARAQAAIPFAPDGARVVQYQGINDPNTRALALLAAAGYAPERHFWRMEIDVGEQTFAPVELPGITIRTFDPARDAHAVYAAMEEAFIDHWGHIRSTFEEFQQFHMGGEKFDPAVWFVAEADGQIAGALIGSHDSPTYGYVGILGVRRPWRGQSVALALLQTSFAAFQRVGKNKVGLGVDAASLTGATRVYERAGMHVAWRSTIMQKELRPGSAPNGDS